LNSNTTRRFENRTAIELDDFVQYVLTAKEQVSYDGTIDGWDESWNLPNALLFTISIMTVVGKTRLPKPLWGGIYQNCFKSLRGNCLTS
jgi:hypothetical protein